MQPAPHILARAIVAAVLVGSCAEPDPTYGDPGAIVGKKLPQEPGATASGGDTGPFGTATAPALTKTLKAEHAAKGAPTPEAVTECLACHGKAATGSTIKWAYGGRVLEGTTPAPNVEVIVVKDATKIGPVKTDADGFFWAPIELGEVPDGSKVHVRKGTTINSMNSPLTTTGGACGATGCHGADRPITP